MACRPNFIYYFVAFFIIVTANEELIEKLDELEELMHKPCGPIQISLYEVTTMKKDVLGRTMKFDQLLGVNHSGLRVCNLEFHFGYEHLIAICEASDHLSNYGEVPCTHELNPQFELDKNGKLTINPRFYLKFGKIVQNIKFMESYHLETKKLLDITESIMWTDLSLHQILNEVVNGKLRYGQSDFPLITKSEEKSKMHQIHLLDGSTKSVQIDDIGEWNRMVARIENQKKPKSGYQKWLNQWSGWEGSSSSDNIDGISSSKMQLYQELLKLSLPQRLDVPDAQRGPFVHGQYRLIINNCVDFGVQFVRELSPGQECQWPEELEQLKVLEPLRIANKLIRKVSENFRLITPSL